MGHAQGGLSRAAAADWQALSAWLRSRASDVGQVLVVVENAEALLVGDGAPWQVGGSGANGTLSCIELWVLEMTIG